jgi:hypothetical protein
VTVVASGSGDFDSGRALIFSAQGLKEAADQAKHCKDAVPEMW